MFQVKKVLKSNKLFFTSLIILTVALIAVGIIAPAIENSVYDNWDSEVKTRIQKIEFSVEDEFSKLQSDLLKNREIAKSRLRVILESQKNLRNGMLDFLNDIQAQKFDISILNDEDEYIGWTHSPAFQNININNIYGDWGESSFFNSDLGTYLAVTDTLFTKNEVFYIVFARQVEKRYFLNNEKFTQISFVTDLSNKFETAFEIQYSPETTREKDGRKFSFDLLNNFKNKIATVSFYRPFRDSEIGKIKSTFSLIQSLILILAYIILGIGGLYEARSLKRRSLRFLITFLYFSLFRAILFYLEIPIRFLHGTITNGTYFSSKFAWGLFVNPVELFISQIFTFIIIISAFRNTYEYFNSNHKLPGKLFQFGFSIIAVLVYLLLMRGFAATIRSIIFDSSFLYFDNPSLVPEFPEAFMHFNILIFGFVTTIASLIILMLNFSLFKKFGQAVKLKIFFVLFLLYQISGLFFDFFQKWPQATPAIRIILITITFMGYYFFFERRKFSYYHYLSIALIGALSTSMMLNFYNYELERESLKIFANELTKPRTNWLDLKIRESLGNAMQSEDVKYALRTQDANKAAEAFVIWSRAEIEAAALKSQVNILDTNKNIINRFSFYFDQQWNYDWHKFTNPIEDVETIIYVNPYSGNEFIHGIAPVFAADSLIGYVSVSVEYGLENLGTENISPFLTNDDSKVHKLIKIDNAKFFDFVDGQLIKSYGIESLSKTETEKIANAEFTSFKEAWIHMDINEEEHLVYALLINKGGYKRIFAAAMLEKEFSFSLFDFFKAFFMQLLYIGLFVLLIMLFELKQKKIHFSFRLKLQTAFLIVSLVPLILLAMYFRGMTENKNQSAISYKLGKRATSVVDYLKDYYSTTDIDPAVIFEKAHRDLDVNYSIYFYDYLVYSSTGDLNNISLISDRLDYSVYNALTVKGLSEVLRNESIEGYNFNTLYRKVAINGVEYIIGVPDVFNPISLPMSETQLDIFLFGSYSLAVMLIVVISTLISNQIALPIKKITAATSSVAGGDLSIELKDNFTGEMKELRNGFNKMVKDLKKSHNRVAEMEREAAWKEMAKQVAHEIKNPLTPMKLSVQQLIQAKKDDHPKFDEMFSKVTGTVIDQIEILKNIASEFSHFARMPIANLEKVNLSESISEALELFSNENININFSSENKDLIIYADDDQLKRSIINLVRNSIQASAKNVNVTIVKNDMINIFIEDDGSGIPDEIKNKIFDENFTTKSEGMGLGLNMGRKFFEFIEGKIEIENTSSSGTVLKITVPEAANG